MTRKDYVLIAAALKEAAELYGGKPKIQGAVYGTALLLASRLQEDNPRFDRGRFLLACNPGGN